MMYTTKMILVPAKSADLGPETEMKKILNDPTLDQDAKLTKCQEIINKYTNKDNNTETYQYIIDSLPKRCQKNAQLLLDFIDKNPHIIFTELGEMIYKGKLIKGSNLIDLVHDFSRNRTTKEPVAGAKEFIKALVEQNVPHEIIGNTERWKLLGQKWIMRKN